MAGRSLVRSQTPRRGLRQPSRELTRAVQAEREAAAVSGARVNRVALTAQMAMQRTAELSEMETRLTKMAPLGEARYQAIADAAAMAMANLVQQQTLDS